MPLKKDDKKIGFIIQYPFHFFVFKNIAKQLQESGQEVEFIIDPTGYFPVKPTEETILKIKEILKTSGFSYREFLFEDFLSKQKVFGFLESYKALVSTWYKGLISDVGDIKKIFVTYGAGKELTTFGFWKREFDLCLSYGDYDHNFFKQLTQSVIVGNPKFDDWFSRSFDNDLRVRLKALLDKNKKTVLYLPTHSDLCSIKNIHTQLKEVTEDYNVVVKVHYYTPREQPELMEMLRHKNIILFEDNADLITLLDVADVVLSDNSSAIFDAMLADKPLLVTDFLSDDYFNDEHQKSNRVYRRGRVGALTYANSVEQRIKKEGIVCSIDRPENLKSGLQEALLDSRKIKREVFTKTLFKYSDNLAGKRAAKAIIDLLNQKEPEPTPYLAFALNKFEASLRKSSFLDISADDKFFCVVIFDSDDTDISLIQEKINELSFLNLKNKIIIVSFRKEKEQFLDLENIKVYSGNDFSLALIDNSQEVTDFIFLYPEVTFFGETRPSRLVPALEEKILSINSLVSSGFVVDSTLRWFNLNKQVLSLEKYQSFGVSSLLYKKFSPQVLTNFWNSGVDDPRFFMVKKEHLLKTIEIFRGKITNFYTLLLSLRLLLLRNGGTEAVVNIPVFTEVYRKNFIEEKYKERALFESWYGFSVNLMLKRLEFMVLLLLVQGPRTLLAFFSLFKLFSISFIKFFFLKYYLFINKQLSSLKNDIQNQS